MQGKAQRDTSSNTLLLFYIFLFLPKPNLTIFLLCSCFLSKLKPHSILEPKRRKQVVCTKCNNSYSLPKRWTWIISNIPCEVGTLYLKGEVLNKKLYKALTTSHIGGFFPDATDAHVPAISRARNIVCWEDEFEILGSTTWIAPLILLI